MPGACKEPASACPTGSLRSQVATYFALLQSWEFTTAESLTSHLEWKRLGNVLRDLAKAESVYHAGAVVDDRSIRTSLHQKLDTAANQLEAFLSHSGPSATPHSTPHSAPRAKLLAAREASPRSGSSDSESSHSPRRRHVHQPSAGSGSTGEPPRYGTGFAASPLSSSHPLHGPLPFDADGSGGGGKSSARGGGALLLGLADWLSSAFERLVTCGGGRAAQAGMTSGLEHLLGQHGLLSSPAIPRFSAGPSFAEPEPPGRGQAFASRDRVAPLLREFVRLIRLRRQMLHVYAAMGGAMTDAETAAVEAQVGGANGGGVGQGARFG